MLAEGVPQAQSITAVTAHDPGVRAGSGRRNESESRRVSEHRSEPANRRGEPDLLVHDMGQRLADGVSQGAASGSEFRTAPPWGLGQRVFFLHDGRTSDLNEVIQLHGGRDSEARGTADLYQRLSETDKQHLLNFLRSL